MWVVFQPEEAAADPDEEPTWRRPVGLEQKGRYYKTGSEREWGQIAKVWASEMVCSDGC